MRHDQTLTRAAAELLMQQPGRWVNWREIAQVAGGCAWRTRLSDARKQFNITIENRVRYVRDNGRQYKISEYRYVPPVGQQRFWVA